MLKEDHTLGNLLSVYLKMAPHVMMAAYKSKATPHPHYKTHTTHDHQKKKSLC